MRSPGPAAGRPTRAPGGRPRSGSRGAGAARRRDRWPDPGRRGGAPAARGPAGVVSRPLFPAAGDLTPPVCSQKLNQIRRVLQGQRDGRRRGKVLARKGPRGGRGWARPARGSGLGRRAGGRGGPGARAAAAAILRSGAPRRSGAGRLGARPQDPPLGGHWAARAAGTQRRHADRGERSGSSSQAPRVSRGSGRAGGRRGRAGGRRALRGGDGGPRSTADGGPAWRRGGLGRRVWGPGVLGVRPVGSTPGPRRKALFFFWPK